MPFPDGRASDNCSRAGPSIPSCSYKAACLGAFPTKQPTSAEPTTLVAMAEPSANNGTSTVTPKTLPPSMGSPIPILYQAGPYRGAFLSPATTRAGRSWQLVPRPITRIFRVLSYNWPWPHLRALAAMVWGVQYLFPHLSEATAQPPKTCGATQASRTGISL